MGLHANWSDYTQHVEIHKGLVMRAPQNFSYETAAAIPEPWINAY